MATMFVEEEPLFVASGGHSSLRASRWRRRWRRYPHVAQRDETDCGAACLSMISTFYGNPVGVSRLRDMTHVDTTGATMWDLAQAGEALGFHARGLRLDVDDLENITLPAVAHWDENHYVVVFEVGPRNVVIGDPRVGCRRVSREAFREGWTGLALELVPSRELTRIDARTKSLSRFTPLFWKYRTMLLEVLGASLFLSLLGLGLPIFTQMVVDRVLVNHSVELLNALVVGMLALAVFQAVVRALRQLIIVHLSNSFDARLIGDFFRHVFTLPLRFFERRRVGDIVSRVRENEEIRHAMTETLPAVVLDSVLAFGYLALLAAYSLELTLVVMGALPFFVGIVWSFTPTIRRTEKELFVKQAEASSFLIEAVSGIATVKAMAAEHPVRWKLESLYVDSLATARHAEHVSIVYSGLATLVQSVSTVLFLCLGAHQVIEGSMSAGQLLAFVAIAGNIITPILSLIGAWDELQTARNAADRLEDVFESDGEGTPTRGEYAPDRIEGGIRFERVRFGHRGANGDLALRDVELEIRPGETLAIVGRSGSGKSTLLKLIQGVYTPTEGRIMVDGLDLRTFALPAFRKRIGVVQQDLFLFSGTILENITLGREDVPFADVVQVARRAGAHEFISKLDHGYYTVVGERGAALSGGERQKLALARALMGDPDLFLFDEATSALDTDSERTIRTNLERECRNRTTVLVAHRLSTVRNADRILVMADGAIVEEGDHESLMAAGGLYTDLAREQLVAIDSTVGA